MRTDRFFQQQGLRALLAGGALAASSALAQVPNGADLSGLSAPADGTVWGLDGDAVVSAPIILPTGATGLTINGQSGVSKVMLTNNGTIYGRFNRVSPSPAGAVRFSLNNVEVTGGQTTVTPLVSGSAINVTTGALTIPATGTVRFKGNKASGNGGAIYTTGTEFVLDGGTAASIWLTGNESTTNTGGAIYSGTKVTIKGSDITITGNKAEASAGAISASGASNAGDVTLQAAGAVTLSDNHANANVGGAIRATGVVTIKGQAVDISNDSADAGTTYGNGGAIWAGKIGSASNLSPAVVIDGEQITMTNNKNFHAQGGAIFSRGSVQIGSETLTVSVKLNDNHSGAAGDGTGTGGAIDAYGSTVTVADKVAVTILGGDIEIARNSAENNIGGAIYVVGDILIGSSATSKVVVSDDHDDNGWGGALFGNYVRIDGQDITLTSNHAKNSGGAIYAKLGNALIGNATGKVTLSNNTATYGGAIYSDGGDVTILGSEINISGNSTVGGISLMDKVDVVSVVDPADVPAEAEERDGDLQGIRTAQGAASARIAAKAGQYGGAIYGVNVKIGNPGGGSVLELTGNRAMYGGVIVAEGAATLTGHGDINGNTAAYGGAIFSYGDVTLNAEGGGITFSGNTGNAIWLENATPATSASATFNTAGGDIVFFDSIANDPDNGLINVTAIGAGAVVFDGSTNVSPVYGATTVAGGTTFTVRNGAGYGALGVSTATPTSFTVPGGATLTGGGTGTVRADQFVLNGTLDIAGTSGAFSTFNIVSGIAGASTGSIDMGSGTLKMNVCLNDAGTQLRDVLNLTTGGSAIAGARTLTINPVSAPGCSGAATTGSGILLVSADSNIASLFAAQAGDVLASANGYDYKLVQVGNNWYLQSPRGNGGNGAAAIPTLTPVTLAALALLLAGVAWRRRRV